MGQIDKILAEIKRLKKELNDYSAQEGLDYIESYINSIHQPSLPSNLDKAAEECSICEYLEEVLPEGDIEILRSRLQNNFKAGAEWMARQGEIQEVEISTGKSISGPFSCFVCMLDESYKDGDKVIVQIFPP